MISMEKTFRVLLALFVLYLIFEIIRKILGGSLGFESLVIGMLLANIGFSFSINQRLSEHIGWHKGKQNS